MSSRAWKKVKLDARAPAAHKEHTSQLTEIIKVMKIPLILVAVCVCLHHVPVLAITGCKKSIEDGIRAFWKTHGTPKFRDCGLMRFAYATKDVSGDDVKCVLASHDYVNHVAPATFYYKNGKKKDVEFKFSTGVGVLHQTLGDKEFLEYLILDQNDVIAFYKCIPNGPTTGDDAAIIAITVGAEDNAKSQQDVNTALDQLISLGILGLQAVGTCPENEIKH